MLVYEFKCKGCGTHYDLTSNTTQQRCESCGSALKRVFTSQIPQRGAAFQAHYNYSVGSYVSSWSEFSDKLKRRGEANTKVTGIEHSYLPLHPSDMSANSMHVTEEGIT